MGRYKKFSESIKERILTFDYPYFLGTELGMVSSTICDLLRRGEASIQRSGGKRENRIEIRDIHEQAMEQGLQETPDLTLRNMANKLKIHYDIDVTPQCIAQHLDGLCYSIKQCLEDRKRIVTAYWLNITVEKGKMEPPAEAHHLPSLFSRCLTFGIIRKQRICITGFEGEERMNVESMIRQTGAVFTPSFDLSVSVLVCKRPEGRKYQAAQRNNVACVNAKWIVDLYQGKLNTLSSDVDIQYTTFTNADNNLSLDRMSPIVQRLMIGWMMPLKIGHENWQRLVMLRKQRQEEAHREGNCLKRSSPSDGADSIQGLEMKRIRLSESEQVLADTAPLRASPTVSAASTANLESSEVPTGSLSGPNQTSGDNQSSNDVSVIFTGFSADEVHSLTAEVKQLGGRAVDDIFDCTHVISKGIQRTRKFYLGLVGGKELVDASWVRASAHRGAWLKESEFPLSDENYESKFGFSLAQSQARAKVRRLFEGFEFWLSPLTKHREVIEELVVAAGGQLRRDRPLAKDAIQVLPKHLIICHEDDSNLVYYLTKTSNGSRAVHHEEFVLTGLMRQEIDYEKYQLKKLLPDPECSRYLA